MASPLNITSIPAPRVDLIDPRTGLMAREWYRFFMNIFVLVGSGENEISLVDVQVGPPAMDAPDQSLINSNNVLTWLSV